MPPHLDPIQPLKVVRKLLHKNCNIGAEGTLDVYLCNTAPLTESPPPQVLLCIFVGLHEDLSFRAVIPAPQEEADVRTDMAEVMRRFSEVYEFESMKEKGKCKHLH